jgi:hypothetical protein
MADEAKPTDGGPAEPRLPMVESPRLDGIEEETAPHIAGSAAAQTTSATGAAVGGSEQLSRSLRFALLAASVAAAAALGSFVGALSAAGVTHLWPGAEPGVNVASNASQAATKAALAELGVLKASVDGAARSANGQFAKLIDRLDRAERVQIESATKIAHVADSMDGLEKKMATTASAAAVPQTTGSIAAPPAASAPSPDRVLDDWIVQDVRGGRALVENRYGGVFDVVAGGRLPGLGRVEAIKRQNGQWIVVTARGLIAEHN